MTTSVLVVGAGPVGLTVALELARYGVPVRVVDKLPRRSDKSKALAVWPRTLELMDRGGVGADLIAAGLEVRGARMMAGAEQLGHVSLEHLDSAYRFVLLVPQHETERVLEEHLEALGVRVERGVELTAFSQSPASVTATLSRANAQAETLESGWLLGCDGAHSFVRHALQKPFEGSTMATNFVLADVHIAGDNVSSSEINMFAHRDGLLMFFPIRGDRFRVIADVGLAGGPHPSDPTLADVQGIIDRRGPGNVTAFDPIWISGFRINERKVEDYRSGRVFLAGDAAHVHSPAGGQGMNTGMQDAVNLAWKLALVSRGTCAEEPLLDSYDIERSPVARAVLDESGRLVSLMTVQNAMLQTLRNHAIHLLFGIAPVREKMAETLSELSIGYPKSPLTHFSAPFAKAPIAGSRAPFRPGEAPVGAGTSPRFALFADVGAGGEEVAADFPDLLESGVRPPFQAGGTWLVRPDGYVAVAGGAVKTIRSYLEGLEQPAETNARARDRGPGNAIS
jgi:2-polyprenyl-6-methoxyphenol hydroxylase-like FAD-dependent oxidoreductase